MRDVSFDAEPSVRADRQDASNAASNAASSCGCAPLRACKHTGTQLQRGEGCTQSASTRRNSVSWIGFGK